MGSASPSLGRATVTSAAVDITLALVALASTPILIRALGAERYGVIGLVTVLASQLSTCSSASARAAADAGRRQGPRRLGSARAALRAAAALAAVSAMAVGGLAWLLAPRAWSDAFATSAGTLTDALRAVPATAALLALQPIVAVVFASLSGLERFAFLNGARILHGVMRVALGVAVALRGGGLVGVLAAQAVADAVMVTVVLVAARRAPVTREPGPPLRSAVKGLLALGVPLSLAGIVAGLLVDGDKLALGTLRPWPRSLTTPCPRASWDVWARSPAWPRSSWCRAWPPAPRSATVPKRRAWPLAPRVSRCA
jgi:O-antigen/teichoic acid export membrane protein